MKHVMRDAFLSFKSNQPTEQMMAITRERLTIRVEELSQKKKLSAKDKDKLESARYLLIQCHLWFAGLSVMTDREKDESKEKLRRQQLEKAAVHITLLDSDFVPSISLTAKRYKYHFGPINSFWLRYLAKENFIVARAIINSRTLRIFATKGASNEDGVLLDMINQHQQKFASELDISTDHGAIDELRRLCPELCPHYNIVLESDISTSEDEQILGLIGGHTDSSDTLSGISLT